MTNTPNLDKLVQNVEKDREVDRRQKWALFSLAGLLFLACVVIAVMAGFMAADRDEAQAVAASEQTQKQEIAQEAQAVICTADDVQVYDQALCARLEAVAEEPTPAAVGPKGDKGDPGRAGRDGKDSAVPGPKGNKGDEGDDSTIPGPAGFTGLTGSAGIDGKDGAPGLDGPSGKDGADGMDGTNGADGAAGPPGANGRSIASVTCEGTGDSSYWLVTYDDGTSQTSGGPCRIGTAPLPQPTEAP